MENILLIICGSSGSGKNVLREALLESADLEFRIVPKYSSRPIGLPDTRDGVISIGNSSNFPRQLDFYYTSYDLIYGFSTKEIEKILAGGKNAVIVITDIEAIKSLKSIFSPYAKAIWIERDIPSYALEFLLKQRTNDSIYVQRRLRAILNIKKLYDNNRQLFNFSIINNKSKEWLRSQLRAYIIGLFNNKSELLYEVPKIERIYSELVIANKKIKNVFASNPELIHKLTPREFEQLISELLVDMGYSVELTPISRDGGFDIRAISKSDLMPFLCLVECKKYSPDHKVGVDLIRNLYGVSKIEGANAASIITTSSFTSDAKELKKQIGHQMSLYDFDKIKKWLIRYKNLTN